MTRKPRKTIDVREFVEANNRFLAAPSSLASERKGVAIAVEHALHMANAYNGYRYLESEYLPAEEQTSDNVLRPDYDATRRRYHLNRIPT
jgi:hypothetical protein